MSLVSYYPISYLKERAQSDQPVEVWIYEGTIHDLPGSRSPFQKITGSQEHIQTALDRFAANCSGTYTVFMKQKRGQSLKTSPKCFVDVSDIHVEAPNLDGLTKENFNEYVNAEIARRTSVQNDKQRIAEMEEQLQRLQNPTERLSDLLVMTLERFLGPKEPVNATLNGQQQQQMRYKDQRGHNMHVVDEQAEEEELTQVELACVWLIDTFGEEDLVRMVVKLQQDPATLNMVRQYSKS